MATTEGAAGSRGRGLLARSHYHLEIFLVSLASLLIEISYTRLISAKLFYYYVYLVIGLALLGIGAGAVAVAISKRLQKLEADLLLFWAFLLGTIGTLGAYVVVALVKVNTLSVWLYGTKASAKSLGMLLLICLCVFVSFVPAGVITATLFGRRPEQIGGLYFADLAGAALACAGVVFLIGHLGAPASVMVGVATMALGAVVAAWRHGAWARSSALVLLALGVLLAAFPGLLPNQRIDQSKRAPFKTQAVASEWGPVIKVDVASTPADVGQMMLYHDDILGATILKWDGKVSSLKARHFESDPRTFPFSVLGTPPKREAIIGAAGGHEVLASLYYGAKHIDAVELNPVTVKFVRKTFANFDGHLADNPRVHYTVADGRSFMARSKERYNLIYYPAPDSYAAASGALSSAYVLSESYLFTTNGIQTMLEHLASNGLFISQFGEASHKYLLRTTRLAATARQALANLGIHDTTRHIVVVESPTTFMGGVPVTTMLVQRQPFTNAQLSRLAAAMGRVAGTEVLSERGKAPTANPVNEALATPEAALGSFYASYPYLVSPTTDNDPYFYHFARFTTVAKHSLQSLDSIDRENSVGERVLLLLLLISVVAAAVLLLLPFVVVRDTWSKLHRKGRSAIYFAGVGFGFIFLEITLMQMLNLFLGYPTYALTVTLMALLVFTGLGALLSQRVRQRSRAIPLLLGALGLLTAFYLLGLGPLTDSLLGAALFARVLVALAVLAPLGLCLGMFMPIGLGELSLLGDHPKPYVAWGWAVNGFASVIGTSVATILAMSIGLRWVLVIGFLCYLLAVLSWRSMTRGLEA